MSQLMIEFGSMFDFDPSFFEQMLNSRWLLQSLFEPAKLEYAASSLYPKKMYYILSYKG